MTDTALVLSLGKKARNQRLLATVLEDAGYDVRTETEPTAFEDAIGEATDPGLAIIDIDGYSEAIWDLCDACRDRSLPVMLVASADVERVRDEAVGHGVERVLAKPLDGRQFENAIDALIES